MPPKRSLLQKLKNLKPNVSEKNTKDQEFQKDVAKFHLRQRKLKQEDEKIVNVKAKRRRNQRQIMNKISSLDAISRSVDSRGVRQLARRVGSNQRVMELLRNQSRLSEELLAQEIDQIILSSLPAISRINSRDNNIIIRYIEQQSDNPTEDRNFQLNYRNRLSSFIPNILFTSGQPQQAIQYIMRQILMSRGFNLTSDSSSDDQGQMDIIVIGNHTNLSQTEETDVDTETTYISNQGENQSLANNQNIAQRSNVLPGMLFFNQIGDSHTNNNADTLTHQEVQNFFRRYSQSLNNEEQGPQTQNQESSSRSISSSNINKVIQKSQQKEKYQTFHKDDQQDEEKSERYFESKSQYLENNKSSQKSQKQKQQDFDSEKNCRYPLRNRNQKDKE